MTQSKWKPARAAEGKYVAVRVGRCDPWCILPRSHINGECLTCGQHCAQGEGGYEYVDYPLPTPKDWTEAGGRANNSRRFAELVGFIDDIIRSSGHALIRGQSESVAQLILSQLAHRQNVGPLGPPQDPDPPYDLNKVFDQLANRARNGGSIR